MEKEFIPYTEALALKELGFDKPCFAYYTVIPEDNINWFTIPEQSLSNGKRTFGKNENYNTEFFQKEGTISAPTFSQSFRWFREKYNIDSMIQPTYSTKYQFRMFHIEIKTKVQIYGDYMGKEFKSYEEAELECLKKLISTVKEK